MRDRCQPNDPGTQEMPEKPQFVSITQLHNFLPLLVVVTCHSIGLLEYVLVVYIIA